MPSTSSSQPVAKNPPKTPDTVLAEAEAQWLFTEAELGQTPSVIDGMTPEIERETRTKGLNFIMQVGIMLKLPQVTLSTASIFFNRFLMRHSLVSRPEQPKALHHYQIAAVALFVASKTEENCRKLKELIVACCRVAQKNPSLVVDDMSKDFWRWRDTLLLNEDVLLEALCFDLSVESPHKLLFDLLKKLEAEHNKKLRNAAWAFVNDSCLTMLCLLFNCRSIAAAAIYSAAKYCGDDTRFADDKDGRPWWVWATGSHRGGHIVKLHDLKRACNYMTSIYGTKSTNGSGAGGSEPSIYVGLATPEATDGEDAAEEGELDENHRREADEQDITRNLNAKTRLRLDVKQRPDSSAGWHESAPSRHVSNDDHAPAEANPANGSEADTTRRAVSATKRSLPSANNDVDRNDERRQKRVRPNGETAAKTQIAATEVAARKTVPADDGGSEEGELEE